MKTSDQLVTDIQHLSVQGATNVAITLLDHLAGAIAASPDISPSELQAIGKRLAYARPTEPLAQNALRYLFAGKPQNTQTIKEKVAAYKSLIADAKKAIATHGGSLIENGATYLTHCHASTVTNIFLAAHHEGKHIKVIATETRPLLQGRLTVKELLKGGINDVTMVIDSAAAAVLSDSIRTIAAVIIGADLLSERGLVNKIGSLALIFAARARNIPVYCFSTLLKYDPQPFTPARIEMRSPKEIWPDAPENLTIYAPAFDYTPYQTGVSVVCEDGLIAGNAVRGAALTRYPFLDQTITR